MLNSKPNATSTPNVVPKIKGRQNIHDLTAMTPTSPLDQDSELMRKKSFTTQQNLQLRENSNHIEENYDKYGTPKKTTRKKFSRNEEENDSEESESSQDEESDEIEEKLDSSNGRRVSSAGLKCNEITKESKSEEIVKEISGNFSFMRNICAMIVILVLVHIAVGIVQEKTLKTPREQFKAIKNQMKQQNDDFWLTIETNIKEIKRFEQPRTILFVYEKNAEKTTEKIVQSISKIAFCSLRDCKTHENHIYPIEGNSLNDDRFIDDYGQVITQYKNDLEENGVLVVKNIEKVPGIVAQAFHSICDEYNPVVKNSLILLTMHIEGEINARNLVSFVEKTLTELWKELPFDDKFYPLFTRISGNVLMVKPEA